MLVAVAPNGARLGKQDHVAVPITPKELADCALECAEAGAAMLHLHVRDENGVHTLEPKFYQPALAAIDDAVGNNLIVQVTSESAGRYTRQQQMRLVQSLAPECVSIALRELIPSVEAWSEAESFLSALVSNGTLLQIILYSPQELNIYDSLVRNGVIPGQGHLLLFVLGRYQVETNRSAQLRHFIAANEMQHRWMCCSFGAQESLVMDQVVRAGGHPRVGFENNVVLPDGTRAKTNSQLVALVRDTIMRQGKLCATAEQGRALFTIGGT